MVVTSRVELMGFAFGCILIAVAANTLAVSARRSSYFVKPTNDDEGTEFTQTVELNRFARHVQKRQVLVTIPTTTKKPLARATTAVVITTVNDTDHDNSTESATRTTRKTTGAC